jgi:hypothetical protein
MPSREQTAEAHSIESRGKRSPRLTPRTSTSTPYERQGERDDHHDGAAGSSETWMILTRPIAEAQIFHRE